VSKQKVVRRSAKVKELMAYAQTAGYKVVEHGDSVLMDSEEARVHIHLSISEWGRGYFVSVDYNTSKLVKTLDEVRAIMEKRERTKKRLGPSAKVKELMAYAENAGYEVFGGGSSVGIVLNDNLRVYLEFFPRRYWAVFEPDGAERSWQDLKTLDDVRAFIEAHKAVEG